MSQSRVRRELEKLKRRGPIVQGSPLCDEICYLSHRLRSDLKTRSCVKKSATDKDFGLGFWPACKKTFADTLGAIPAFSIVNCRDYFLRVLSLSDSLSKCLFKIPSWFLQLPPPATPLDQTPPSYVEIASIIKRARAGSSACPLDQVSVLTLKNVQFLEQFCIISLQIVGNLNTPQRCGGWG